MSTDSSWKSILLSSYALMAVTVAAPLVMLIGNALLAPHQPDTPTAGSLLGIRQFVLLGKSILVAVCAGLLGTLVGLAAGYSVSMQPYAKQRKFIGLLIVPFLIPPFIHALCWIMFWGWFNKAWFGFWPTIFILSISFYPLAALLSWAGLVQSRGSMTDAALLSHRRFKVFTAIELGLIKPHLWTSFLLISLFSFSDYAVPSFFRFNTYPVIVFSQFAAYYDLRGAIVSSWPYIILPIVAIVMWRLSMHPRLFETSVQGHRPRTTANNVREQTVWRYVPGFIIVMTAIMPIVVLLVAAGGMSTYSAAWHTGHTQVLISLLLAAISATLMVIIGACVSIVIHFRTGFAGTIQDYASLLPVAVPGTLFGIGTIVLWNHRATSIVCGSAIVIVLLQISRFLPFAVRSQLLGMKQIGSNLLDAAKMSNTSFTRTYRRIVAPLLIPSMVAGWVLCFILSFSELTGTLLVAPPGIETLSVRIYSLYHYGAGKLVAALSLFMIVGSLIIIGGIWALFRGLKRCFA